MCKILNNSKVLIPYRNLHLLSMYLQVVFCRRLGTYKKVE
jgi:hypothetical protein